MTRFLKSLTLRIPAVREHMKRVMALAEDRNRLESEVERLRLLAAERGALGRKIQELTGEPVELLKLEERPDDWAELKERKRKISEEIRAMATTARLSAYTKPLPNHLKRPTAEWIRHQVESEPYWFQKIEVYPGFYSPGWSDPASEKLPYFGLPEDLTGMRVLDIGCAEGFFSFEAERRGAREVVGIDSFPDSVRRFNIVKAARQSNATAFLMNVYDLEPKRLGTFDLVLFYGVFYHLKHPQYALERIRSICTGTLLFQTHVCEEPAVKGIPWARFYPHGYMSGRNKEEWDPTVFWLFNVACCLAMVDHVGFTDLKVVSNDPKPFVISAKAEIQAAGVPPDQTESPWC